MRAGVILTYEIEEKNAYNVEPEVRAESTSSQK